MRYPSSLILNWMVLIILCVIFFWIPLVWIIYQFFN